MALKRGVLAVDLMVLADSAKGKRCERMREKCVFWCRKWFALKGVAYEPANGGSQDFVKKVARILFLYYIYCQWKRSGYTGFSVGTEIGECGEVIESDSFFAGCADLPEEMLSRLDEPWVFIGEIKQGDVFRSVKWYCRRCASEDSSVRYRGVRRRDLVIVECRPYEFVTDDRIWVVVYFGVCSGCGSVHWGRSGPPFRRVSSCVRC